MRPRTALVVSCAKAGTAMAHIRAATAALFASILVDIMDTLPSDQSGLQPAPTGSPRL
jgi:hypothetical protein